jgi:hypothetical protein
MLFAFSIFFFIDTIFFGEIHSVKLKQEDKIIQKMLAAYK